MKKIGGIVSSIVPFLVAFGIQIIVSFLAVLAYGVIQGIQLAAQGITDASVIEGFIASSLNSEFLLGISALSALVSIVIFGLWYKRTKNEEETTINKVKFTFRIIIYMLLLGVGLQIGISIVLNFIAFIRPEWFEGYSEVMEQLGMGNSPISILYIALIAPISEELIFRGVILKKASKSMPFAAANILQALLFGIYHMNLVQGIYAFVIGVFLGFVCYQLKTIYGSILLHMVINISGILLTYVLTDEILAIPGVIIIVGILSLVGIVYSTISFSKINNTQDNDFMMQ